MQYTVQVFFNGAGEQVLTTCGHKHQLIAKAVKCVKKYGKQGGSALVVRLERGRVVQLDTNEVQSLRAACHYHRVQGVEGAV